MARSSYVYVIHKPHGPTHGFTVKHELVTFLRRYGTEGRLVTRTKDGDPTHYPSPVLTWDAARFLEEYG